MKRRTRLPFAISTGIILLLLTILILYTYTALKYKETFLPGTTINGIDVSGMNTQQVKAVVNDNISHYHLELVKRDGTSELIKGSDIDLNAEYGTTLDLIIRQQNPFIWGMHYFTETAHTVPAIISYDNAKLLTAITTLSFLDPNQTEMPMDAQITYRAGYGYQIIPEEEGNELLPDRLYQEIAIAVSSLKPQLDLYSAGLYTAPQIRQDDPQLTARLKALAPYASVSITYRFGDSIEILDGDTISNWLSCDDENKIVLQQDKVTEYIKELSLKYNTAYCTKQLKTTYGPTVSISRGHYGWMIDQEAEAKTLTGIIQAGRSETREPVYRQTAASHNGPDYGSTYIEMNLTAQHLFFYKNGKLLIESDFVSGNEAKGWATPAGAYELTYKQRNATLKGKNYQTPVTYWMPFNGNIGMHDGYWRSSFGGTIYKTNGSHGCINLPPAVAKTIFEQIEAGVPVLCYHLDGTEQKSPSVTTTGSASHGKTGTAAETTAALETTTAWENTSASVSSAPAEPASSSEIVVPPVAAAAPETIAPAPEETAEPETIVPQPGPVIMPDIP